MKKRDVLLLIFSLCVTATLAVAHVSRTVIATLDPDGVQRVAMTGGSYYFDPDRIVVKVNLPVELKVRKEPGLAPHDIVLKAPEAGIDVSAKLTEEPTVLAFTPRKTGVFTFYCDKKLLFFESHRDKGMHGVLEVVE
ncbi:cupredoxin domain-containing protein [Geomesophilobacter sediminis]|uniref:Quinol oxidase n=1 Tax=Geomesophilobacter sediminis TaxID=2798584 RepID=A0A8J7LYY7_9BACT|nr:quinol oxidase [Geomesophilobacter sediminis]MBJ6725671.1 quinol oxidase [Geomesophilobacter sediminis]